MKMDISSVMVTGAVGFLGRHISAHLAEKGFKCLAFSHGQLDITDAEAVVLRLTWMYEKYNAECPHADVVSRILAAAAEDREIKASTREYRGISDVDTVCDNIIASFGILPGGVYNFGSGNIIDSYSTLVEVSHATGLPEGLFVPDDSWGRNLSMDCSRLSSFGLKFPDTVSALSDNLKACF